MLQDKAEYITSSVRDEIGPPSKIVFVAYATVLFFICRYYVLVISWS